MDRHKSPRRAVPWVRRVVAEGHYQIGEVAEDVGLSLRTIRYYEEIGLVTPSGRTDGGFRLYLAGDIERLRLIKALKPVGMPLEAMTELLGAADQVASASSSDADDAAARLEAVLRTASDRCDELERHLEAARVALSRLSGVGGRSGR